MTFTLLYIAAMAFLLGALLAAVGVAVSASSPGAGGALLVIGAAFMVSALVFGLSFYGAWQGARG